MAFAIYSTRRGKVVSAGATPAGGQGADEAPSQGTQPDKGTLTAEMRRIRMLYGFEGTIARGMIPWNEMRIAFNMIDEYTRQRDVAQTSSPQGGDSSSLERIEKTTNKLEKLAKNEKQTKA